MGRPLGCKVKAVHSWTDEEKEYLKKVTPGHHHKEIQALLNKKFNLKLTASQVKGAIARFKLSTGLNGQFKKGCTSFNKGKKGLHSKGSEKTWFKKGKIPVNRKPVGSEKVSANGYTFVKVAEPDKWRLKQQIVWEFNNQPIEKGHVVIFADGNKGNFDIKNLLLVSREKLLMMNRNNLIQDDAELTKTGAIVADVLIKISEKRRAK